MGVFDILGSTATDSLEQVLAMTQDRNKVLADNIANIDTPGYRMRDVDTDSFDAALARALERSHRANPNRSRLVLPEANPKDPSAANADGLRSIVFHDDNDRSIEKLVVELGKNSSRHGQAAELLRTQLKLLRSVISENA